MMISTRFLPFRMLLQPKAHRDLMVLGNSGQSAGDHLNSQKSSFTIALIFLVSFLSIATPPVQADVGKALIPLVVSADAQSQRFRESIQKIQDGDVSEGLRRLQGLHEEIWGKDLLIESYRDDHWLQTVPISQKINQYLMNLPEDQKAFYVSEFSTRAFSVRKKAISERDPFQLFRVAQLFPLMDFRRDALVLSGELFFEMDEPDAAINVWQQASRIPVDGDLSPALTRDLAERIWLAAQRAGREELIAEIKNLYDDLDEIVQDSAPVSKKRKLSTIPSLSFEEGEISWKTSDYSRHIASNPRQYRSYFSSDSNSLVSPGVDKSRLAIPTSSKLLRYDLRTGKLISDFNLRPGDSTFQEQDPNMRLWAVEGEKYILTSYVSRASRRENYLGYDIQVSLPWRGIKCWGVGDRGGRLLWDTSRRDSTDETLRTTSFNSRPIIQDGKIYALGWRKSGYIDVSLWCLDAETGKRIWMRPLVGNQVELTMFGEPSREPILGSLLIADDVVYSCSNLGAIAAMRAWDGKVLWISEYERVTKRNGRRRYNSRGSSSQAWKPNPLILKDGYLFATPLDSSYLYSLSAKTGALNAKVFNNGGLGPYMLGIVGNRLFLAGDMITSMIYVDIGREELYQQSIVRNPSESRPALVEEGVLYINQVDGCLYLEGLKPRTPQKKIASLVSDRVRNRNNGWNQVVEVGGVIEVLDGQILITNPFQATCITPQKKSRENK